MKKHRKFMALYAAWKRGATKNKIERVAIKDLVLEEMDSLYPGMPLWKARAKLYLNFGFDYEYLLRRMNEMDIVRVRRKWCGDEHGPQHPNRDLLQSKLQYEAHLERRGARDSGH